MGAEQTYEWAVRYPDMVKRALPFAGTAKTTPHDFIFVRSHEDTLEMVAIETSNGRSDDAYSMRRVGPE